MSTKSMMHARIIIMTMCVCLIMMQFSTDGAAAEGSVNEAFKVSDGVQYKDIRLSISLKDNAVRVMEMDLNNPYTQVEIGYPAGLNKLIQTTAQAHSYHREGHEVVGAINGGFNHLKQRVPINLIAENNILTFAGKVSKSKNSYVNEPIAFGIDKNGKGLIDRYHLSLTYTYNGTENKIVSINKARTENDIILYAPSFRDKTTGANQYGTEIVVVTDSKPDLEFGSEYNGTVTKVRAYGDPSSSEIPENGFVLSGHGKGSDQLADLEEGDKVSLAVDIDKKWQNASFMLASGPALVEDGQVNLSMNPDSWRAAITAPRTAVAIDKTGEKVFFITVDGRQKGYSDGMNLTEFAEYLVEIGADRALNLDGGGSTTMAVRYPGELKARLANNPSDGRQRGVSTILMAVSNAPEYYSDVPLANSHREGVYWLTEKGIQGYEDGTFGVRKQLTRSHAAVIFSRVLGLDHSESDQVENLFKDVKSGDMYASFIAAAGDAGIFNGSDGNFMPGKTLTREQMATTLVEAFGLKDDDAKVDINLENVDPSHKANVQIIANLGVTNQLEDFRPKEPVTRGQFATFLYQSKKSVDSK